MTVEFDSAVEGRIFDIERYSTHDGPGIRTTVFLKGCYLNCRWCHNPESISPHAELMFDGSKCLLDLGCAAACKQEALYFVDREGGRIPQERIDHFRAHKEEIGGRVYNAETCLLCGSCVDVCFARALEMVGEKIAVGKALEEVGRDRAFYASSGGGVTVSGGEPLVQHRFTRNLLAGCRQEGLHTALDTTAYSRWEILEGVLEHADLVLLDLKLMDAKRHRENTGVDNKVILENARRLAAMMSARREKERNGYKRENTGIWVRVPVIPSINDDEMNMRATARFVREEMAGAIRAVELLGYHLLGGAKLERLGKEPVLEEIAPPAKEHLKRIADLWKQELEGTGIAVKAR